MYFDWFDARMAVNFGKATALEINKIFPHTSEPDEQARTIKSAKKEMKKLDGIMQRVQIFSQQNRLNIYKKAKLLNALKWDLSESGQDEEFINDTVTLVARLLK